MNRISKIPFTKEMKKATKDVHDISDSLVNAKLAFALSSDEVWADGILVFYEIFRFLEEAMDRLNHSLIGDLDIAGMRRTEAFKKDLTFYLGKDWEKDYKPREIVAQYVSYLEELERTNPYMLMAYVYHLYMGLLTGGQILQRKRQFFTKYIPLYRAQEDGCNITKYEDRSIYQIKKELVRSMDRVAESLGEKTKQQLIKESRTLFLKNNEIIKSVKGATEVLLQKLVWLVIILMMMWAAYNLGF